MAHLSLAQVVSILHSHSYRTYLVPGYLIKNYVETAS